MRRAQAHQVVGDQLVAPVIEVERDARLGRVDTLLQHAEAREHGVHLPAARRGGSLLDGAHPALVPATRACAHQRRAWRRATLTYPTLWPGRRLREVGVQQVLAALHVVAVKAGQRARPHDCLQVLAALAPVRAHPARAARLRAVCVAPSCRPCMGDGVRADLAQAAAPMLPRVQMCYLCTSVSTGRALPAAALGAPREHLVSHCDTVCRLDTRASWPSVPGRSAGHARAARLR